MRITALVLATLATALPAYAAEPFAKSAEIQIGGLGRFDYLNVDSLTVVQTLETARGARTMTIVQATHRLYIAAVEYLPADPANPKARPHAWLVYR